MAQPTRITRRHWLRRGAGALLAANCWPGRLRAADNGRGGAFHFVVINDTHLFTERKSGGATLLTNRCCAISRDNHDGSPEKGFFLCAAREGGIDRRFIEVHPPAE